MYILKKIILFENLIIIYLQYNCYPIINYSYHKIIDFYKKKINNQSYIRYFLISLQHKNIYFSKYKQ